MFDALDRKLDSKSPTSPRQPDINYRDEPVAFFFVLYGIAFEALITKPGSGSQESEDETLEILMALKKILRPSVAGRAIYQDVVFSETMELFDRLAQTEGLAVQGAIVEITRNLCLAHPSAAEEAGEENLSDDIEQLFELTRIIVLVLAGVLPNLGEKPATIRHHISDEAVALITLSLDALVDAADVFPTIIRTDIHACIIHIFTTILGTGVCQASVVPKALPIFRRFIQSITDVSSQPNEPLTSNPLAIQLRTCLTRFRSILFNAQRRETDASLQCARNTLMACAILLTNGAENYFLPKDPLITKVLDDLLDCLPDLGLGKVAANCSRSLLLLDPKNDTAQTISSYLIPRLLKFYLDASQSDPENAKIVIVQSFVSYLAILHAEEYMALLCILLPALLKRAGDVGKERYADTAARLLSIAAMNQAGFKGVVSNLSGEMRGLMEEIIMAAGSSRRDVGRSEGAGGEPSIALKLNFG